MVFSFENVSHDITKKNKSSNWLWICYCLIIGTSQGKFWDITAATYNYFYLLNLGLTSWLEILLVSLPNHKTTKLLLLNSFPFLGTLINQLDISQLDICYWRAVQISHVWSWGSAKLEISARIQMCTNVAQLVHLRLADRGLPMPFPAHLLKINFFI